MNITLPDLSSSGVVASLSASNRGDFFLFFSEISLSAASGDLLCIASNDFSFEFSSFSFSNSFLAAVLALSFDFRLFTSFSRHLFSSSTRSFSSEVFSKLSVTFANLLKTRVTTCSRILNKSLTPVSSSNSSNFPSRGSAFGSF